MNHLLKNSFDEMNAAIQRLGLMTHSFRLLAVGSSTGGPRALRTIFEHFPADFPLPVVVAQHMSPGFMKSLALHLNEICPLNVVVAENGMPIRPGTIYFAPDEKHMLVEPGLVAKIVDFIDGKLYVPSADVLFDSVAEAVGNRAIGVILTGMGNDGAEGLLRMRQAGAHTIAESKETAVVYGMPKVAVEKGAATEVLPLYKIAERLNQLVGVSAHD